MKCLVCQHWATAKMIRVKTVTIGGADFHIYRCNVCGNEAYIPASKER